MQIELTKGLKTNIDATDFELISGYKWHALKASSAHYAGTQLWDSVAKKRSYLLMHRLLMNAAPGVTVDHINGDTLDNRRGNLRIASYQQNSWNKRSRSTSGFLGVRKSGNSWLAIIFPNHVPINLGVYETKELAACAYNEAAKIIYGEFARLNEVDKFDGILERIISNKKKTIERIELEIKFLTAGLQ